MPEVPPRTKSQRKPISDRTRFLVLRRDGYRCQYCGRCAPDCTLELDHLVPVAKGGTNDPKNLVVACLECNRGKRTLVELPPHLREREDEMWEDIARNDLSVVFADPDFWPEPVV